MFFCDAPGGNLQEQKDLNNGEAREAFGYRCVVCTEPCSKRPPEVKREDTKMWKRHWTQHWVGQQKERPPTGG